MSLSEPLAVHLVRPRGGSYHFHDRYLPGGRYIDAIQKGVDAHNWINSLHASSPQSPVSAARHQAAWCPSSAWLVQECSASSPPTSLAKRKLSGVYVWNDMCQDSPQYGINERLASARDRLAESAVFCESDAIFEVVRTRSVHEGGYGHNRVRAAA